MAPAATAATRQIKVVIRRPARPAEIKAADPEDALRKVGMPGHTLMYEVDATCTVISRGAKRIVFKGHDAYTDNVSIVLPAVTPTAIYETPACLVLRGYANHEASHCRYTDWSALRKGLTDAAALVADPATSKKVVAIYKTVSNIVEDCFIERTLREEFPGTRLNLDSVRRHVVERAHADIDRMRGLGPVPAFYSSLLHVCNVVNGWSTQQLSEEILAAIAEDNAPIVALNGRWADRIAALADSVSAHALSLEIVEDFIKSIPTKQNPDAGSGPEPEADPSDAPGDAGDGDPGAPENDGGDPAEGSPEEDARPEDGTDAGPDDAADPGKGRDEDPEGSDGEGDETEGEGDDGSAPDGSDPSQGKGPEGDGEDDGGGDPDGSGEDDAGEPGDSDEPGDGAAGTGGDAGSDGSAQDDGSDPDPASKGPDADLPDDLDQALGDVEDGAEAATLDVSDVAKDVGADTRKAEKAVKAAHGRMAVEQHLTGTKVFRHDPVGSRPPPHQPTDPRIARAIRSMAMSTARKRVARYREEGDFDVANIMSQALGTGDIYKRVVSKRQVNTAMMYVVDQSGSMSGMMETVGSMTASAAEASFGIPSLKTAACSFTSIYDSDAGAGEAKLGFHVLKDFDDPPVRARASLAEWRRDMGDLGGTPTAAALLEAGRRLDQRKEERRIVVLITDGAPDNADAARAAQAHLRRRGISVYLIEIGNHATSMMRFDVAIVARSEEDLPEALEEIAKIALRRGGQA